MPRVFFLYVVCALSLRATDLAGKRISQVTGPPASVELETRAGDLFDPAKLQHDVRTLWQSLRLSDVRVEAELDGDDVRVIFHLQGRTMVQLRKIRVDPPTPGVRVELEPGTTIDWQGAQQIAAGVRQQLERSGYVDAKADARLIPVSAGTADLQIHVQKRRPVDIGQVAFYGELGLKPAELRHALRATRTKTILPGIPGIWKGWHYLPGYNADAIDSDLANLRSLYYQRNYFDADVQLDSVDLSTPKAGIGFRVHSGPQHRIAAIRGIALPKESEHRMSDVCREFFHERRAAERAGVLDFSARVEISGDESWVNAAATVTTGRAYRVGRIEFRGNHRFRDESLRRTLLLDEGAPLDQTLLRKSLGRLNQTGWFEPLSERNVVVNTPPGSDRAGVAIAVKEKKTRNWSFSGPVGPLSVAGPLRLAIGSRLPAWGQGALELSTFTVSLNLMLFAKPVGALLPFLPHRRFIQLVTIERPLLPGQRFLSGFSIAPQLGWQGMLAGYGMSQTRTFLQSRLQTDSAFAPDLLVTVAHNGREGTLRCEPAKGRFDRLRQIAGVGTNLLLSFSPL